MAIRLIEERARLGYSQADFARQTGISREGLRLYEVAQRGMSAEFLAAAMAIGLDAQYILSGHRSKETGAADEVKRHTPPVVDIGGSNTNVIGVVQSGGTVHQIHTQRHINKTIAKVTPGDEHITEEQAVILTTLVGEIIETEKRLKSSPASHRSVWGSLNSHCGVTQYRLIKLSDFERARKYLQQWLGRLNSMRSAPVKNGDEWRKKRYAYIKINSKANPQLVASYLKKYFQAESLTQLSDDQLDRVYRYVAKRPKAN